MIVMNIYVPNNKATIFVKYNQGEIKMQERKQIEDINISNSIQVYKKYKRHGRHKLNNDIYINSHNNCPFKCTWNVHKIDDIY